MSENTTDQEFLVSGDVATFVQSNVSFYLPRWTKALTKRGSLEGVLGKAPLFIRTKMSGWNWGAFLVPPLWLAYRKMWGYTAFAVVLILGAVIFDALTGNQVSGAVGAVGFTLGLYGNTLYLRHVRDRVREIQSLSPDLAVQKQMLANAGGTSWIAALGVLALVVGVRVVVERRAELPAMLAGLSDAGPNQAEVRTAATIAKAEASPVQVDVPNWRPWLSDFNGLWQDGEGSQFRFSLESYRLLIDDPQDAGTKVISVQIIGADDANDSVTFNIQMQTEGEAAPFYSEWTFRKQWNDAHTRFTLMILLAGQPPAELSYVRQLFPAEIAAMVTNHETLSKQSQGNPSIAVTTGKPSLRQQSAKSAVTAPPALANWNASLSDMTGVWQSEDGSLSINFLFTSQRAAMLFDNEIYPLQLTNYNTEHKFVSFTVKDAQFNPNWTAAPIEAQEPKGFYLMVMVGREDKVNFHFVRDLNSAERSALSRP